VLKGLHYLKIGPAANNPKSNLPVFIFFAVGPILHTIVGYNSSVTKSYIATNSLVCTLRKFFSALKNATAYFNATAVNAAIVGLAPASCASKDQVLFPFPFHDPFQRV
jgi:hypothetical protein